MLIPSPIESGRVRFHIHYHRMLNIEMNASKSCPVCDKEGITSELVPYQISLEDAIYMCPRSQCVYPLGQWDVTPQNIFKRNADEVAVRAKKPLRPVSSTPVLSPSNISCTRTQLTPFSSSKDLVNTQFSPNFKFRSPPPVSRTVNESSLMSKTELCTIVPRALADLVNEDNDTRTDYLPGINGLTAKSVGSSVTSVQTEGVKRSSTIMSKSQNLGTDYGKETLIVNNLCSSDSDYYSLKKSPSRKPEILSEDFGQCFIQWKNRDALCWLDVTLILLVFCSSLSRLRAQLKFSGTLIKELLSSFGKAQDINRQALEFKHCAKLARKGRVMSILTSIGKITVKVGGGTALMNTDGVVDAVANEESKIPMNSANGVKTLPKIQSSPVRVGEKEWLMTPDELEDRTVSLVKKAEMILEEIREKVWKGLHAKLGCDKGSYDSPVFSLPVLLREHEEFEEQFRMTYEWHMTCEHCQYRHVDPQQKTLPSFPRLQKDFNMATPCFRRSCFKCHSPGQKMTMIFKKLPPTIVAHFVDGLHRADLRDYDFTVGTSRYLVRGVVHHVSSPDHFIGWVRCRKNNKDLWMVMNDLESAQCEFRDEQPSFDPSQTHLVMWERENPRHTNSEVSTEADVTALQQPFTQRQEIQPTHNTTASSASIISANPVLSAALLEPISNSAGTQSSQSTTSSSAKDPVAFTPNDTIVVQATQSGGQTVIDLGKSIIKPTGKKQIIKLVVKKKQRSPKKTAVHKRSVNQNISSNQHHLPHSLSAIQAVGNHNTAENCDLKSQHETNEKQIDQAPVVLKDKALNYTPTVQSDQITQISDVKEYAAVQSAGATNGSFIKLLSEELDPNEAHAILDGNSLDFLHSAADVPPEVGNYQFGTGLKTDDVILKPKYVNLATPELIGTQKCASQSLHETVKSKDDDANGSFGSAKKLEILSKTVTPSNKSDVRDKVTLNIPKTKRKGATKQPKKFADSSLQFFDLTSLMSPTNVTKSLAQPETKKGGKRNQKSSQTPNLRSRTSGKQQKASNPVVSKPTPAPRGRKRTAEGVEKPVRRGQKRKIVETEQLNIMGAKSASGSLKPAEESNKFNSVVCGQKNRSHSEAESNLTDEKPMKSEAFAEKQTAGLKSGKPGVFSYKQLMQSVKNRQYLDKEQLISLREKLSQQNPSQPMLVSRHILNGLPLKNKNSTNLNKTPISVELQSKTVAASQNCKTEQKFESYCPKKARTRSPSKKQVIFGSFSLSPRRKSPKKAKKISFADGPDEVFEDNGRKLNAARDLSNFGESKSRRMDVRNTANEPNNQNNQALCSGIGCTNGLSGILYDSCEPKEHSTDLSLNESSNLNSTNFDTNTREETPRISDVIATSLDELYEDKFIAAMGELCEKLEIPPITSPNDKCLSATKNITVTTNVKDSPHSLLHTNPDDFDLASFLFDA